MSCCVTGEPGAPAAPCVHHVHSTGCKVTYQSPVVEGETAVIGYLLEYNTSAAQSWNSLSGRVKRVITGTSVNIRELHSATGYEFRVAAVNSNGVGEFSRASTTITTDSNRPSQPGRPMVRVVWVKSVDLEWTMQCDSSEQFHYIIRIYFQSCDTVRKMFVVTDRKAGPVVQHSLFIELKPDVSYHFAVAAVNAAGVGPYSPTLEPVRFLTGKFRYFF